MTIAAASVAIIINLSSPINGIDPLNRHMICGAVEDIHIRTAALCIPHGRFYSPHGYCLMCFRDRKE
jgi:hypothetical protein